jgi:hypothetical protein
MTVAKLQPGQTVRIRQTIHTREGDWQTDAEGKIVSVGDKPTGSWFAHGKDDRLWLRRVRLEKSDGELIDLNLDRDSVVTILAEG